MAYSNFDAYWPDYVRAHSNKLNRTLHAIGVGLALACIVAAVKQRRPWLLLGAPLFGYGFAWAGHFFVEKNAPATFSHPLYSLRASLVMFFKTVSGRMDDEVARILQDDGSPAAEPHEDAASEPVTAVN